MATWLERLNLYRAISATPPIQEDVQLSTALAEAVTYIQQTSDAGIQFNLHSIPATDPKTGAIIADPKTGAQPKLSKAAKQAAATSNLMSGGGDTSEMDMIDGWISIVFHGIQLIDPALAKTGFAIHRDPAATKTKFAAGINTLEAARRSVEPGTVVKWPGDGSTIALTQLGGELPDPRASYPAEFPTDDRDNWHAAGLPIMLLLGKGKVTSGGKSLVSATSLTRNGTSVAHCKFDESDYTIAKPTASELLLKDPQALGRNILAARGGIVLLPARPLEAGDYSASITVDAKTYTWSFTVGATSTPASSSGSTTSGSQVRLGPAGAKANPFDDASTTERITSIDVYSGEVIDAIRVTHSDGTVDPIRGGTGIPAGTAGKETLSFDSANPLIGISGEWGTWYGGTYITKIQFHMRTGTHSRIFGTGASTTNTQSFDLRVPNPTTQQVTGFFGSVASANNDNSQCLGSIGIAVR